MLFCCCWWGGEREEEEGRVVGGGRGSTSFGTRWGRTSSIKWVMFRKEVFFGAREGAMDGVTRSKDSVAGSWAWIQLLGLGSGGGRCFLKLIYEAG